MRGPNLYDFFLAHIHSKPTFLRNENNKGSSPELIQLFCFLKSSVTGPFRHNMLDTPICFAENHRLLSTIFAFCAKPVGTNAVFFSVQGSHLPVIRQQGSILFQDPFFANLEIESLAYD